MEKYREFFASEEVPDTYRNYEIGKLAYFASAPTHFQNTARGESQFKIWNPICTLPIQIAQEMEELLTGALQGR